MYVCMQVHVVIVFDAAADYDVGVYHHGSVLKKCVYTCMYVCMYEEKLIQRKIIFLTNNVYVCSVHSELALAAQCAVQRAPDDGLHLAHHHRRDILLIRYVCMYVCMYVYLSMYVCMYVCSVSSGPHAPAPSVAKSVPPGHFPVHFRPGCYSHRLHDTRRALGHRSKPIATYYTIHTYIHGQSTAYVIYIHTVRTYFHVFVFQAMGPEKLKEVTEFFKKVTY